MKLDYLGLSIDGRTNKWRITCDCGNTFSPPTTMFSKTTVVCPKCAVNIFCDFNEEVVKPAGSIWIGSDAGKSIKK